MATGIIGTDARILLTLAWLIEGRYGDTTECTDSPDNGIHETRPLYRRVYRHTQIVPHPDGIRFALTALDGTVAPFLVAVKAAIRAKVQTAKASTDETAIDALPAAAALDATWTPAPENGP